jgi:hypothetical protein
MRPPALVFALVITAELCIAALPQQPEAGRPASKGDFMKMRGCVNGSLLTATESSPATVAGALTGSNRYRLVGTKEIRAELKRANGKLVDVTGRIRTDNRAVVKGKKSGKNTFVIGATQGTTSPMEEQPVSNATIEVDSVSIVGTICNAM